MRVFIINKISWYQQRESDIIIISLRKVKKEGGETVTHCHLFKLIAEDGKKRLTDLAKALMLTIAFFATVQKNPDNKDS